MRHEPWNIGHPLNAQELYEIKEVRIWIRRLVEMCPYVFYFLSPLAGILPVAIASFCKITKVEGEILIDQKDLALFVNYYIERLESYAEEVGHSQDEVAGITKSILACIIDIPH